jgi:hypothetical protein
MGRAGGQGGSACTDFNAGKPESSRRFPGGGDGSNPPQLDKWVLIHSQSMDRQLSKDSRRPTGSQSHILWLNERSIEICYRLCQRAGISTA